MAYFVGVDIGSNTAKSVIIDEDRNIIASRLIPSGINYRQAAENLREELLTQIENVGNIAFTVATGQGGGLVEYANERVTDLRCCARGINTITPSARTIIDVEDQSTQVMRISQQGFVTNFVVSEKCAAGCGRFIHIMSNVLQVPLDEIGELSLKSSNPITFTTACAVFGESEAVSRVSEGVPIEDILAGVHNALADKIASLVGRVGLEENCVMCGGGALNKGLVWWVEKKLGVKLLIPPQPQLVTALGAALIALALFNDHEDGLTI